MRSNAPANGAAPATTASFLRNVRRSCMSFRLPMLCWWTSSRTVLPRLMSAVSREWPTPRGARPADGLPSRAAATHCNASRPAPLPVAPKRSPMIIAAHRPPGTVAITDLQSGATNGESVEIPLRRVHRDGSRGNRIRSIQVGKERSGARASGAPLSSASLFTAV